MHQYVIPATNEKLQSKNSIKFARMERKELSVSQHFRSRFQVWATITKSQRSLKRGKLCTRIKYRRTFCLRIFHSYIISHVLPGTSNSRNIPRRGINSSNRPRPNQEFLSSFLYHAATSKQISITRTAKDRRKLCDNFHEK